MTKFKELQRGDHFIIYADIKHGKPVVFIKLPEGVRTDAILDRIGVGGKKPLLRTAVSLRSGTPVIVGDEERVICLRLRYA